VTIPTHIGKYEIERRLGGGGMAEVFLAHLVGAEGFSRGGRLGYECPSVRSCFGPREGLALGAGRPRRNEMEDK
jgi:hypothetical protein